MKVPSHCGGEWAVGEETTAYRLAPDGPDKWFNTHVSAVRVGKNFRIEYGMRPQDYAYLAPLENCYARGFYREDAQVVAILRKDGDDLILTFHTAEGAPGPNYIEAIDR